MGHRTSGESETDFSVEYSFNTLGMRNIMVEAFDSNDRLIAKDERQVLVDESNVFRSSPLQNATIPVLLEQKPATMLLALNTLRMIGPLETRQAATTALHLSMISSLSADDL